MAHHYVTGAGLCGCLFDHGPNFYATRRDAIADAEWYIGCFDGDSEAESSAYEQMRVDMPKALRRDGVYYFPELLRPMFGHYVSVSKVSGPCPKDADD
jgi:hypothetical protein